MPSEGVYTCFLKKGSKGVNTSIECWVSYKPQKEALLVKISACRTKFRQNFQAFLQKLTFG
ncbi:hypothetical protein EGI24_16700 [Lacihabitans sp. CS3-21]|nr:hypothetical protein [Lacihabitans sp. CS3-21]